MIYPWWIIGYIPMRKDDTREVSTACNQKLKQVDIWVKIRGFWHAGISNYCFIIIKGNSHLKKLNKLCIIHKGILLLRTRPNENLWLLQLRHASFRIFGLSWDCQPRDTVYIKITCTETPCAENAASGVWCHLAD